MRWYTFWDDQGQFHRLPSVTTILNLTQPPQARAQLTQALANHPLASTRKRQTSRQRGDRLDQWFKACCHQGKLLPIPAAISPMGRQLKPYLAQLLALPQPLYPNQPVFNPDHGYAGTLDLVAGHPLTPGLVLYELKSTGYKIWPQAIADAELQAAAYALAWPHQFPDLSITALATLHVTPYSLKENLILDPGAIAQLQGQFLKRLRGFGAAYSRASDQWSVVSDQE